MTKRLTFRLLFVVALAAVLLITNSDMAISQANMLWAATKTKVVKTPKATRTPIPRNEWIVLASDQGKVSYASPDLSNLQPLLPGSDYYFPDISPDGSQIGYAKLGSGHQTSTVWIMNLDGSNPRKVAETGGYAGGPVWSPDGKHLAFVESHRAEGGKTQWAIFTVDVDGQNLKSIATASDDLRFTEVEWTPNGKKLTYVIQRVAKNTISGEDIWIMDADGSNQEAFIISKTRDHHLAWSPNGKQIAFVSQRDAQDLAHANLYVADANGKNPHRLTNETRAVDHPVWSLDGKRIMYIVYQKGAYVIDATGKNSQELRKDVGSQSLIYWGKLKLPATKATPAATQPAKSGQTPAATSATKAATAPATQGSAGTPAAQTAVITADNASQIQQLSRVTERVDRVMFGLGGNLLLFGEKGNVMALDVKTARKQTILPENSNIRWIVKPNAAGIVGNWDKTKKVIQLFDFKTRKQQKSLPMPDELSALAISPNGQTVAIGKPNGSITLWDVKSGKQRSITTEQPSLYDLAFSPDGKLLASAGSVNVRIWNVQTGKRQSTEDMQVSQAYKIFFSPDGKLLATLANSRDFPMIWDVQTGKAHPIPIREKQSPFVVAFSPKNDVLAVIASGASEPGKYIQLWDLKTNKLLTTLTKTKDDADVLFNPAGTLLVSLKWLNGVTLWGVAETQ